MALGRPIRLLPPPLKWIGCSERHLPRLCSQSAQHRTPLAVSIGHATDPKSASSGDSEVETLQSSLSALHRRHHATPTS